MKWTSLMLLCLGLACTASAQPTNKTLPRADWGAPLVNVSHKDGDWVIAGQKQVVALDEHNLALHIQARSVRWDLMPSSANDMLVKWQGKQFPFRLADARSISIVPYDTGFKTGIKMTLTDWKPPVDVRNGKLDLTLYFTVCLEGEAEDLVFDIAAREGNAFVYQLDWPTALDPQEEDYTVLSNRKGDLLPRDWPKEYLPIRNGRPKDHSVLQSHVIEDWAMSWWGFERSSSAMMVMVQTPNDAAYQFSHPAGGPTIIGPCWHESLGSLRYPRAVRFCFFPQGNYVDMAKRYREYVMNTGLFVSLKEKIARDPGVAKLIGTPQIRIGILHNQNPKSDRYNSANHYRLTTFDERAKQLHELKADGIKRAMITITGWGHLGYDRQHPDPLPPSEAAGGWAGLKRLTETCRDLGYPFVFHDQYRDYYTDAPSWDPQSAIHEEDTNLPATAFAGSRFGDWKEGRIPFMRHWDGGPQSYLNARFMPGNLRKNYVLFFKHDIHPDGIYLDVFGYVPPDEDFNPKHPTTRGQSMRAIGRLFDWSRHNLGIVATEAGSDWVIPSVDTVNQSGGVGRAIPVPLYQLVYHDAIFVSFGGGRGGVKNLLRGILYGAVPQMPVDLKSLNTSSLALIKEMAALNKRVALLAMTNHEFLDPDRDEERTTFADGTTVTVDWNAKTVKIDPPL